MNPRHHGLLTPLFAIRVKEGFGIGSYRDLIPLIDLACRVGFSLIQLLPIHDTGQDPSPYNAIDGHTFHPIYLSLEKKWMTEEDLHFFHTLDPGRLDYHRVLQRKLAILKRVYLKLTPQECSAIESFLELHPYLKRYALMKINFENPQALPLERVFDPRENIDQLFAAFQRHALFYIFLQKLIHEQLEEVSCYAKLHRVHLMFDMPILLSPDSCEVRGHPHLFLKGVVAGTPPDSFNQEGQYWGFPIYDWSRSSDAIFDMLKEKMKLIARFFPLIRIDHILGFFRFFAIPKGLSPAHGRYIPSDEKEALANGRKLLSQLIALTNMEAVGEDLGTKIDGTDSVLDELNIHRTVMAIWEKKGDHLVAIGNYPYRASASLSNHDLPLFAAYWHAHPQARVQLQQLLGLPAHAKWDQEMQLQALKALHRAPCRWIVNPIQEYLNISKKYFPSDLNHARINTPGTVSPTNWTYRMPVSLDDLGKDYDWLEKMLSLSRD